MLPSVRTNTLGGGVHRMQVRRMFDLRARCNLRLLLQSTELKCKEREIGKAADSLSRHLVSAVIRLGYLCFECVPAPQFTCLFGVVSVPTELSVHLCGCRFCGDRSVAKQDGTIHHLLSSRHRN